jgi:hypothetical protein
MNNSPPILPQQSKTNEENNNTSLLPTPVSPIQFGSLLSQFSLKDKNNTITDSSSPSPPTKLFSCPDCNQVFHRAHNLKSHKATHSASKPYQVR